MKTRILHAARVPLCVTFCACCLAVFFLFSCSADGKTAPKSSSGSTSENSTVDMSGVSARNLMSIAGTTLSLAFPAGDAASVYYKAVSAGSPVPEADAIKASGTVASDVAVDAADPNTSTFTVNGLTPWTDYDIYFVAADGTGALGEIYAVEDVMPGAYGSVPIENLFSDWDGKKIPTTIDSPTLNACFDISAPVWTVYTRREGVLDWYEPSVDKLETNHTYHCAFTLTPKDGFTPEEGWATLFALSPDSARYFEDTPLSTATAQETASSVVLELKPETASVGGEL